MSSDLEAQWQLLLDRWSLNLQLPSLFVFQSKVKPTTTTHFQRAKRETSITCVSAVCVLSSASLCQRTIQRMSSWAPSTPKTSLGEEPRCLLTPPPTRVITPASCSLGLAAVVNVLVELCDVGGKRLSGWGQPCGMLLLREVGWGVRHRLS